MKPVGLPEIRTAALTSGRLYSSSYRTSKSAIKSRESVLTWQQNEKSVSEFEDGNMPSLECFARWGLTKRTKNEREGNGKGQGKPNATHEYFLSLVESKNNAR
jgi:hypothetical protein